MKIRDIEFVHLQEFIFDKSFWKKRHFIFLNYACKTTSKKVRPNSEAQEYVWASVEKALKLPVEPYTRMAIEAHMRRSLKEKS